MGKNNNLDTPKDLLRAVFFCNGKHFCLRGGQKQRYLKLSKFIRETSVVDGNELSCYVYCEYGSKNRPGNFTSLILENKIVRQYENVKNPGKCHVKILDKYLSLIPTEEKERDAFYLTPLPCKPQDPSMPWYSAVPVGRNWLDSMLKKMCQEAGVLGKYSNHSLRAGGATTIYQVGVLKKLIQERTGHRSIDGLRRYEQTSEAQLVDISNVVANNEASVKPIPTNSLTVQD